MHDAHRQAKRPAAGWDAVAPWYREHLREEGSLLREVVYPGALRMLGPMSGKRVVDVACGEGTFAQALARAGATVLGVDASPVLVRAATAKRIPRAEFVVGDARQLAAAMRGKRCDAAVSLMALANMDPIAPVFTGVAAALAPGAPFVVVLAHPCFRIPRQSTSRDIFEPHPPSPADGARCRVRPE